MLTLKSFHVWCLINYCLQTWLRFIYYLIGCAVYDCMLITSVPKNSITPIVLVKLV